VRRAATNHSAEREAIGPYDLLGTLGRGGMGVVYRARHRESGALVALKAVRIPDKNTLHAIRREVQALARIQHPGVVRILGEGVHDGLPWYAMELLDGVTLRRHVAELLRPALGPDTPGESSWTRGPTSSSTGLSGSSWWTRTLGASASRYSSDPASPADTTWDEEEAASPGAGSPGFLDDSTWPVGDLATLRVILTLVRRLCAPLAFLHGEGIVHRDLKPDNVLVRPDGLPVLVDFGLVSRFTREVSRDELDVSSGAVGTIAFMAPEQLRGELVDARADLYSLGCLMYYLLTGHMVFEVSSIGSVARAHLDLSPRPPSELAPAVPPALDALVMRLLAKRPRDRLGYADDVAVALERLGAEDGLAASGPPSRPYLYRPGLAGRDEALRALEQRLDRLEQGHGGIELVGGESGVGKTRLVMELARRAERRRILVLAGQGLSEPAPGSEEAKGAALHPLRRPLEALADRCREQGAAETERIFGRRGPLLALYAPMLRHLPGLEAYAEPAHLPAEAARLRLFAYLAKTFLAVSSPRSPASSSQTTQSDRPSPARVIGIPS
jgi:serine/threonine protein kinase